MSERAEYREQLTNYKNINESVHNLHWDLQELDEQIAALSAEARIDTENDQRIARRIADLRIWKDVLEERLLQQMIAADELAAELARTKKT
jgi:predicted RNase H-like nuclease (RuvC/YqgF family)